MSLFNQGDTGSASAVNTALASISNTGESVLTELLAFKEVSLLEYQNVESYINSRRVLANRITGARKPLAISASDFSRIDQGKTTCSVRADSGVVTTRETTSSFVTLDQFSFSSNVGNVLSIDSKGQLYTVVSDTLPVGTFDVELQQAINCQVISFDVSAMLKGATFQVYLSSDKLTYVEWTKVSVSGYRVTAFGDTANTKYIRLVITPVAPDLLVGENYTFGLTELTARGSQFALRSEFNSRPVLIRPSTSNLFFGGEDIPGVTYYVSLSLDGLGEFTQVPINTVLQVPNGAEKVDISPNFYGSGPYGLAGFTPDTYLASIQCKEYINGVLTPISFIPGLRPDDPNLEKLTKPYCYFYNNVIYYGASYLGSHYFQLTYYRGPAELQVRVKVVLDTASYGSTPLFQSVYFECV